MKYRVTEITGAKESNGQIRTGFKVAEDSRSLSTFSDKALQVGQEIEGNIVVKQKDGKTYNNFYFPDARPARTPDPVPADNRFNQIQTALGSLNFKIDTIIGFLKINVEDEARGYPYAKREGAIPFAEDEKDPLDNPF